MLDNHVTNISEEVRSWLLNFNKAISNRNNRDFSTKLLKDLFFDDSHWRDILALTWKIQTFSGSENISQLLYDTLLDHKADGFIVNADRTAPREVTRGGKNVIEAILKFKTKFGECDGIVRLYQDREDPTRFRAWSLLTALHELNSSNNLKDEVYKNSFEGPNWLDIRNEDKLYKDRDPEVIVVGSGQAGLSIAARLKQQNIDTLIVDKNDRVGDNWRNRYHSLKLHNQTHVNHLPYMPFPSTWPTYIPKDKLAGWFEYYAESMELNVWTQTTFLGAEYNEVEKKWIVNLKLSDGNVKIM